MKPYKTLVCRLGPLGSTRSLNAHQGVVRRSPRAGTSPAGLAPERVAAGTPLLLLTPADFLRLPPEGKRCALTLAAEDRCVLTEVLCAKCKKSFIRPEGGSQGGVELEPGGGGVPQTFPAREPCHYQARCINTAIPRPTPSGNSRKRFSAIRLWAAPRTKSALSSSTS